MHAARVQRDCTRASCTTSNRIGMKGHTMMMRAWVGLLLATVVTPMAFAADAKLEPINVGQPQKIEVYPATITLSSQRDTTRLVITGHYADGSIQDLTRV